MTIPWSRLQASKDVRDHAAQALKSASEIFVGVSAGVNVGRPGALERSLGKAKHVIDKRNLRALKTKGQESQREIAELCSGPMACGRRDAQQLRDATTGMVIAEASSAGIDFRAVLEYARRTGGPALRRLTFPERAGLLKRLAKLLTEKKDEFYALSYATGATRRILDRHRRRLWHAVRLRDRGRPRAAEQPCLRGGRSGAAVENGTFVGQHICTPLDEAAVHINAFNFPVWGMLEKLSPTLLAGMPAIVKPATTTSYLTELVVRRIIESGVLPEGSLQLICGNLGDLFEHLTCQDVVSFTGSASTAQKLRSHPVVIANSVRFISETDSINSCVLAPDAAPGEPEFDAFVREVAREMTAKAGQKCTAIRKALVPAAHQRATVQAIKAALAKVVVGDPRLEQVRMGPLASLAQRREVLGRIAELRREAELVSDERLELASRS